MTRTVRESAEGLRKAETGNHLVLWYKTEEGRAKVIAQFLGPGVAGDSLIAIILPLRELRETEKHLRRLRFPVDRLLEEGRLSLFASEELLPANPTDFSRIGSALKELRLRADKQRRGLMLVGRVAPLLFERGECDEALVVEKEADSALGDAKLLCLYDTAAQRTARKEYVDEVNRIHDGTFNERDDRRIQSAINRKGAAKRMRDARKGR